MAGGAALRRPLEQGDIEALGASIYPARPLPALYLVLDADAEGHGRRAQAYLVKVRPGGFMVALPDADIVLDFVAAQRVDEDEPLALEYHVVVLMETPRGRRLREDSAVLVISRGKPQGSSRKATRCGMRWRKGCAC